MEPELTNYKLALEASLSARKEKFTVKEKVRATHFALLLAKEALRNKESDLLEDSERNR